MDGKVREGKLRKINVNEGRKKSMDNEEKSEEGKYKNEVTESRGKKGRGFIESE